MLFTKLRGRKLDLAVWFVAAWAIAIFGYNQSSAGGVLPEASFNRQFPALDTIFTTGNRRHHNSTNQGTVVALYTLLGTFGALSCSIIGDRLGRRRTIFIASAVSAVGAVLMATSQSLAQFIVSRMVTGLGTGGIIATVSVWHAELSKAEHRGSHVSGFGIFCGTGLTLATWLDFAFSHLKSSASWRVPLAFPAIFTGVVMILIFDVPESPRWLLKMKRVDEANAVLSRLYDTDIDSEVVLKDSREMQASFQGAGKASIGSIFTMGSQRVFHRAVLAVSAQMFLQLSGINSVAYYTPVIFQTQLNFTPTLSVILAASSQICLVLGSIVCSFCVDRFGRRRMMLISASSMAVCMACLAGLTSDPTNTSGLKAAVFFIFLYYFVYTLGFLGIPFLYASEIAPVHLRAAVCGISTAASWIFNFLVVEVTPVAFDDIGYRYFIVYAAINAVCVPTVYLFFPETAKHSLEDIDSFFVQSNSIFDPVRVAKGFRGERTYPTAQPHDSEKGKFQSTSNGKAGGTTSEVEVRL